MNELQRRREAKQTIWTQLKRTAWSYGTPGWDRSRPYVIDRRALPTPIGANPTQSFCAFAQILADRIAAGPVPECTRSGASIYTRGSCVYKRNAQE
jgi:hypothetical protein